MFNNKYFADKIQSIENNFNEMQKNLYRHVQKAIRDNHPVEKQSEAFYGIKLALCVDTKDPLGLCRVKFYSPALHDINTPIKSLPFARPVMNFGGFDDSGGMWVPPAGSTLILIFENGDRDAPYYIGTTWTGFRGLPPSYNWNYPVQEFFQYHSNRGEGYLVGATDGSQTRPPWNTEFYNIPDFDDINTFEQDPNAKKKITVPYGKGLKTEEKHRLKFVDGQYDCNYRFKRVELASGDGNLILLKDDHLHSAQMWGNPSCCGGGITLPDCTDAEGNPIESASCENPSNMGDVGCSNPLYKRQDECFGLIGVGTPLNNRVELPQSGMQFLSRSGQSIVMDDSVNTPQGNPGWQRTLHPFDYGCDNTFKGKMQLKSSTGHQITLNDSEDDPEIRSSENGIFLRTATGNRVDLNDHTLGGGIAGDQRGILIESTSMHTLEFNDGDNEQASSPRQNDGQPNPKAKSAFVMLRSGYGLQMLMRDDSSQESTDNQFIELLAPMKDNTQYGPHILRMQESASGPGIVYLRAGGVYFAQSINDWIETVGTDDTAPVVKFTQVKGSYVIDSEDLYFNHASIIASFSEEFTLFLSDRDCIDPETGEHVPCLYPVLYFKDITTCPLTGLLHITATSKSDYVYGSSNIPGE
jgi:hypothetical protein